MFVINEIDFIPLFTVFSVIVSGVTCKPEKEIDITFKLHRTTLRFLFQTEYGSQAGSDYDALHVSPRLPTKRPLPIIPSTCECS